MWNFNRKQWSTMISSLRKETGSFTLKEAIDWVKENGTKKPSKNISDARWNAMVKHIQREYNEIA